MVRKLFDLCMIAIEPNLKHFSSLHIKLPNQIKELLLYRLIIHSRLTLDQQPFITYNLFAQTLKHLTLAGSTQISDNLLNLLTQCECKLSFFSVKYSFGFSLKALKNFLSTQDKLESVSFKKLNYPISDVFIGAFQSVELQQVSFSKCDFINDKVLMSLSSNCPNISCLKLERLKNITDQSLTTLFINCNSLLKEVKLVELSSITEKSIKSIIAHCDNLEKLTLQSLHNIFNSSYFLQEMNRSLLELNISLNNIPRPVFNELFTGVWQLKTLNLVGLELFSSHFDKFAKCFSQLENLMIVGNQNMTDIQLEILLKQIGSQLKSFDYILAHESSDKTASLIAHYCTNLEKVGLTFDFTGSGLMPLLSNPLRALKLTSLDLTRCSILSTQFLETVFRNCLNLENLYLRGVVAVDDTSVLSIANNLKKMKYISFRGCRHIHQEDSLITLVLNCPDLKLLGLTGHNCISDRLINVIADNLPNLEELYIEGCSGVSRHTLDYLINNSSIHIYIEHNIL